MLNQDYLLVIAGMGVVTYMPRWLPLFFLSQRQMPQWLVEWLDMIPVAILCALIFPDLFISGQARHFELFQAKSLAALPTLLFALTTRSLGATVVLGMLLYWLLERFV